MNGGARINLEDAWPISDEEGRDLTGYTFTIENKCEDPVNYIIALESLESTKGLEYLNNEYVKLAIDDEIEKRYGSLETIENVVLENDPETIRETKEVTTSTVQGNTTNEHTIRIWLSEDAPLTEQNKVFASRVRITGGQGVENTNVPATADACFEIDENGEILGYDESCGESVVIPAKVNGTPVKTIDTDAFKSEPNYTYPYTFVLILNESYIPQKSIVMNPDEESDLKEWANANGYGSLPFEVYTDSMVVEDGILQYCNIVDNQPDCVNRETFNINELIISDEHVVIDSLDLSQAIYLEAIEARAFTNVEAGIVDYDEYSNYDVSLTSLTFGENDRGIEIGYGAFARIDVDELVMYTSYVPMEMTDSLFEAVLNEDYDALKEGNYTSGFLEAAEIDHLIIKPTSSDTVVKKLSDHDAHTLSLYQNANMKNITIDEGITELEASVLGFNSSFEYADGTLSLPSTLTKIGILTFDHIPYKNIEIPVNVVEIGQMAFRATTEDQTITLLGRSDTTGMTLGSSWSGEATIVYAP